MPLYTAQYRYSGGDRLDITVKSSTGFGRNFAPTWDMVMGTKKGTMSVETYIQKYFDIIWSRPDEMARLALMAKVQDVTLVCFCGVGQFCHRILLAKYLRDIYEVQYIGERKVT